MKIGVKKIRDRKPDDSLFGLLSSYKPVNTYFRIFVNEEKKLLIFQMTKNPKFFARAGEGRFEDFRILRRTEIGTNKLLAKYLSPDHILEHFGETLGIKIPRRGGRVVNGLGLEHPVFQLETTLAQGPSLIAVVKKILLLSPQKKYEIIEKFLSRAFNSGIEE